jgi:hypothetical protein
MGDLQVGERYKISFDAKLRDRLTFSFRQCNMDFILLSTLVAIQLLWLVISYDIACQYAIHFWKRMKELPAHMHLTLPKENVWWKVPNFHLPDHKPGCHTPYSFHWMPGAGMTHGETIEQNWAFSNGAAASTRRMGPGSRHATLEDIFGFHNYDRLLAMRKPTVSLSRSVLTTSLIDRVLPKRLATAIKDGTKHKGVFESFTAGLEEEMPTALDEWRSWVQRWEAKQHTGPEDSPPTQPRKVMTSH